MITDVVMNNKNTAAWLWNDCHAAAIYGIDPTEFWKEVNAKPTEYEKDGIRVNKDTYYLNHFIKCAHDGTLKGLNNKKLRAYGEKQKFYKGIPEIFEKTANCKCKLRINKGIGKIENIGVNSKIPEINRRVHFENMIYIADGPSDIPAFSVVKKNGGATFAIYPKGDWKAMRQVEQMREDGRVDMYAEADYSEGTTAYMWITNKIQKIADRIRDTEKAKIKSSASGVPRHLV